MSLARIFTANALVRVGAAASGQLFAFLLAERHGGEHTGSIAVGALAAAYFGSELLAAPLAGRRGDIVGHAHVLRVGASLGAMVGIVGAASGALPLPFAALLLALAAARVIEGLAAALTVPATLSLVARSSDGDPARRTRLMGLFEVTSLLAMIVGYVLAGVTWDTLGWASFLTLLALYLAARAVVPVEPVPPRGPTPSPRGTLRVLAELARQRRFLGFAVAWLTVNAVVGLWMQHTPYLMKLPERSATQALVGGFSGSEVGAVFAVWGGTFLVGALAWSALGGRVPRRAALSASLLAMLGVLGCLFAANRGAGPWVLFLAGACVVVESGFTPVALSHLAEVTREGGERGAAMGVYSLLLGLGQLIGGLVGAPVVARWQMDGMLALSAALAGIALVGVLAVPRR
ncbi:MAG: MFS transporter [Polyangiaceae bacterium]|nr:MFS transporter [Polyangiaceae bacterium]